MRKCLFITDKNPFPPRDGLYLPIAEIAKRFATEMCVDILIVKSDPGMTGGKQAFPEGIRKVLILDAKRRDSPISLLKKIKSVGRFYDFDINQVQTLLGNESYDIAWISPITCFSLIRKSEELGIRFYKFLVLGGNDVLTFLYRDSINELLYTKIFDKGKLLRWIRSYFIYYQEKDIFKSTDLIHLQTETEKNKALKIIGKDRSSHIVVSPNGVKSNLFSCRYRGRHSNNILYLTHLSGGRAEESRWFITKVWPIVKDKLPEAKLNLVGKPPLAEIPYIRGDKSIIVRGFVDNYVKLFDSVRISVVPTFHGTGLINRILDSLTAGVPTVSTFPAISTFPNISIGKEIAMGKNAEHFAQEIIDLYGNQNRCQMLHTCGRDYARRWPTWEDGVASIKERICALVN